MQTQDCGGEVVTAVDDVPCDKCGQMAYPCPCEQVTVAPFRIQYRKSCPPSVLYTCAMQFKTEDDAEKQVRTFQNLFPYYYNIVRIA